MDLVTICICTFRRPELLRKLLRKLQELTTDGEFEYSVVVVDNDADRSGESVVQEAASSLRVRIQYDHERERSISFARNRSVRAAAGNLVAFIDDDEFPDSNWLKRLHATLRSSGADGVLGPVLPHFEQLPPRWLVRSGILARKRFVTGHLLLDSRYTRTGNALLVRSLFASGETWFDPAYGLSGGGDAVFFDRQIKGGRRFVWCDEAVVYETVPPERQTHTYYLQRAFTRGMTSAWEAPFLSGGTLKSVFAVLLYGLALPLCCIRGHHCFMKYLVKLCDHLSKLLAYLGIVVVKHRPYAAGPPS